MQMRKPCRATAAFLLCTLASAQGALAAITNPTPQRAYVSALSGSDANNCGQAAPCRTIQAALAQVVAGGEVLVLDSGGYGFQNSDNSLISITQSVTITVPPGLYAGISPPTGFSGVSVNAPGAVVTIRGLTINGNGGNNGVQVTDVGTLTLRDCVVTHMAGIGVTAAGTTGTSQLLVMDSFVSNNFQGILIDGGTVASVVRTTASSNTVVGFGAQVVNVLAQARMTVTDSIAEYTLSGSGLSASSVNLSFPATIEATNVVANHNAAGFQVGTGGFVTVSGSSAIENNIGFEVDGQGFLTSAGNNKLSGNVTAAVTGTVTLAPTLITQ